MAKHLKLEELMIFALERDFKPALSESYISRYFLLKDKLYREFLTWIRANEPMLSDHGPDHIDNVLDNAYQLLGRELDNLSSKDETIARYKGIDLYFLCTTILFHDVGNFYQRKYHNENIQFVINNTFSDFFYNQFNREKNLIIAAGRAHSGKENEDTLKNISETEHSAGHEIKLQEIAAIVRLADELAEGPQRTCKYMSSAGKITPESEIYHRYAECTHLKIDAKNGRINIAYDIYLDVNENQVMPDAEREKLKELLEFIHKRVFKLDQERKYCGYYCDTLKSIKETQVSFSFYNQGILIDFKLNPLILTDLTVPGDNAKSIVEGRTDLEIDTVVGNLDAALSGMSLQPKISCGEPVVSIPPDESRNWFSKLLGAKK